MWCQKLHHISRRDVQRRWRCQRNVQCQARRATRQNKGGHGGNGGSKPPPKRKSRLSKHELDELSDAEANRRREVPQSRAAADAAWQANKSGPSQAGTQHESLAAEDNGSNGSNGGSRLRPFSTGPLSARPDAAGLGGLFASSYVSPNPNPIYDDMEDTTQGALNCELCISVYAPMRRACTCSR